MEKSRHENFRVTYFLQSLAQENEVWMSDPIWLKLSRRPGRHALDWRKTKKQQGSAGDPSKRFLLDKNEARV